MTKSIINLTPLQSNIENWVLSSEISLDHPQFTKAQLKHLFWQRDKDKALNRCCKMIGKRLYVNKPMFALWMAGEVESVVYREEA